MIIEIESWEPVLVVDDMNAIRYSTKCVLTAADALVVEAVNAAQSLAPGCGATILDINLLDIDGFEFARRQQMADSTRHILLIFPSAQCLQDDRARGTIP